LIDFKVKQTTNWVNNKIYLYEMLTMNLLQAMLVRRAEQSHWQSSNSAIHACYAHIHRSSIALWCSQTTRSHDQMIMWLNSEWKLTSKWSAFTIHRSSIALWCSQTTRSHDQMIMWLNSEWKLTSKWSAFTIHRSSIASRCSQTTQSSSSLLN